MGVGSVFDVLPTLLVLLVPASSYSESADGDFERKESPVPGAGAELTEVDPLATCEAEAPPVVPQTPKRCGTRPFGALSVDDLPLIEWLRENVHRHGKRYRPGELIKEVSGRDLSHRPFIDYLNAKFKPLYGLS